jgi:hypothetical protein
VSSPGRERQPRLPDAAGISAAWGAHRAGAVLSALAVLCTVVLAAAGGLPAAAQVARLLAR